MGRPLEEEEEDGVDSFECGKVPVLFRDHDFNGCPTGELRNDFDEHEPSDGDAPPGRTIFWESQEALLQEILERYSYTGLKLREEISEIVERAKETKFCCCKKQSHHGCILCLRRSVVRMLCDKGFDALLCVSKWKPTKKFPGGTHEYIEVIATTQGRRKQVPILIELEFRDQFSIAKGCDEYRKLVSRLPEYYIGKGDYLNAVVHVLCDAAKRSMKEKKLHMGPWRKRGFMQMKWSCLSEKLWLQGNKIGLLSPTQAHDDSCLRFSAAPAVIVT